MKTIINYILIISILIQSIQWHPEDLRNLNSFFSDAIEHLESGDTLIDFLQKHYGKEEIVIKHLNKKHPDRKKSDSKHTHHIETLHVWSFNSPEEILIQLNLCAQKLPNFYKEFGSCVHIKPLYSPPELI